LHIGDRLRIKQVLLEIASVRIPCATFAARMGDPEFVVKFKNARRPGVYARVLEEGEVQEGDQAVLFPEPEDYPGTLELFDLCYTRNPDPLIIRKFLEAPIDIRTREKYQKILEKKISTILFLLFSLWI
jgi:MOSC domain-containing protein YiiM